MKDVRDTECHEKQAGQMGKTENRLIIHQYSKPGAVPVGVVYGNVVARCHMFPFSLNSPSFSTLDPNSTEICSI